MAHAQKLDLFFPRNGRVHLNRRGRQFSRLLAAEVCASAVVMLDTPCSEKVWRVLATHCIRHFPLHFPTGASPCAITFQPHSNSLPTFRDNLPVPSSRVKKSEKKLLSWLLKLGPIGCPANAVRSYHRTLRNAPEERRAHVSMEFEFTLSVNGWHHFENQWRHTWHVTSRQKNIAMVR